MPKAGWVYVLSQDSRGDGLFRNRYVKVGETEADPHARADGMKTGTPYPLDVEYAVWTEDTRELERAVHERLEREGRRVETGREFFRPPLGHVVATIEQVARARELRVGLRLISEAALRRERARLARLGLVHSGRTDRFFLSETEAEPLLALEAARRDDAARVHEDRRMRERRTAQTVKLGAWLTLAGGGLAAQPLVAPLVPALVLPAVTLGVAAVVAAAVPARLLGAAAGRTRRLGLKRDLAEVAARHAPPMLERLADPAGRERPKALHVMLSSAGR